MKVGGLEAIEGAEGSAGYVLHSSHFCRGVGALLLHT